MKRITIAVLATVLLAFGITACKKQDGANAPAASGTPSTTDGSQAAGQSSTTTSQ